MIGRLLQNGYMSKVKNNSPYDLEYKAFAKFIRGEHITLESFVVLVFKSFVALFEMCIRYIPGGFGYTLRYWYYKVMLKDLGENVLIDVGVSLNGTKNISVGDYTWLDSGCRIDAMLGEIKIGKRVHIAPYAIVASREPIIIEDYAAVGAGAKIYSNSEYPFGGKRMSGPMIPEEYKAFYTKKIVLEKDSCVGTGAVLLPGAYICEGAVVGANSVIKKRIEPYDIVAGLPPRVIGKREKISVPDL